MATSAQTPRVEEVAVPCKTESLLRWLGQALQGSDTCNTHVVIVEDDATGKASVKVELSAEVPIGLIGQFKLRLLA